MIFEKTIILGAGLTGLMTAEFISNNAPIIFEKTSKIGGMAKSFKVKDYIFDYGGHYLHFQHKESYDYFSQLLAGEMVKKSRRSFVYIDGKWVPYPVQIHFPKIFPEYNKRFLQEIGKNVIDATNYEKYLKTAFGTLLFEKFFFPYNDKFWKTDLKEIDVRWTEKLIPRTDVKKVQKPPETVGYNQHIYYPPKGIGVIADTLAKQKRIMLNSEVIKIDIENKLVFTINETYQYENLVSTIPLTELLQLCELPYYDLDFVSVMILNVGLEGICPKDFHWVYLPQKDTPFYRLGKYILPESDNTHSFYFEHSYRESAPDVEDLMVHVQKLMTQFVIEGDIDEVLELRLKHAYPILKVGQKKKLSEIQNMLVKNNVIASGRMGSWRYISMEDSYFEAKRIADHLACSDSSTTIQQQSL